MRGDVALDRLGVRIDHLEALRQGFEVLETRRPARVAPEGLADGLAELGREGRLQAQQRHAPLAGNLAHRGRCSLSYLLASLAAPS